MADKRNRGKEDSGAGLVAYTQPKSAAAEAYRTLRTNIQFASPDSPVHTILATSTSPDDGKSTTIANLAITFAASGFATVLVDADLRRPHLHKIFGLSNDTGLTTLVAELARAASITGATGSTGAPRVHHPLQPTQVDNLHVLTSGPVPPNPAEILGSQRMNEVLAMLRDTAEYVLIDTPPIIAVTDAAVLAPRVDGVLLVINAGKTRRDLAVKARDMLQQVNAHLLGVVLNNATLDKSAYVYYG
ncbi:MAG TPA: CpsD/CapB family tyrosine-protein kinase [Chloroflexia bacterium]|nr:CpsD/CapB family tyrosine-protein kinase [Chloroflexia bacterium]